MLIARSILLSVLLGAPAAHAAQQDRVDIEVDDTDITIDRFRPAPETTANGHLLLWISPGFGITDRVFDAAGRLADRGFETWYVDIASNLFLPGSTHTLRTLDASYISALIDRAHAQTGNTITLVSRAYGVIPLLHGARQWQAANQELEQPYLNGAILFSPELYSEIPPLGQPPRYMPIAEATSIPIMLVQAGNRGNRWQLPDVIERLQQGGAAISVKLLPGVTGVFYHEDQAPETLDYLRRVDSEIQHYVRMLSQTPIPMQVAPMQQIAIERRPLDISLRAFTGDFVPPQLELPTVDGRTYARDDYSGQVTVVNFWASWCAPCVEEIPSLNRLRTRMAGKAFELISVNYAEAPATVRAFLQMVEVDFPVLLDESGQVSANWKVLVYPATYIIAPDGSITYAINGAIHWDSDEVLDALDALIARR